MPTNIPGVFEAIPEPTGEVAIYVNGVLHGYCRDQAHADEWCPQFLQALRDAAPVGWQVARVLWKYRQPVEAA
jgi:hypothetical protein